jgi:hypothetical protein
VRREPGVNREPTEKFIARARRRRARPQEDEEEVEDEKHEQGARSGSVHESNGRCAVVATSEGFDPRHRREGKETRDGEDELDNRGRACGHLQTRGRNIAKHTQKLTLFSWFSVCPCGCAQLGGSYAADPARAVNMVNMASTVDIASMAHRFANTIKVGISPVKGRSLFFFCGCRPARD